VTDRILLVDDEPRILDALRRNLHGLFTIDTAASGAEGLALFEAIEAPYAVVISDMMMPGMDGAEFLARAHAAAPDTVQMILSGQAELSSTIAAVNDGNLFRFLTKPCEGKDLIRAIEAALAQYRLINSERDLLDHTLNGAVEVLTELMSATNPAAFSRTERVKSLVHAVLEQAPVTDAWELRIAAMLGQVGLMAVPEEVLTEIRGEDCSPEAIQIYRAHPDLASDLIRRIPRLQNVAQWVAAQPVTMADATTAMAAPTASTSPAVTDAELSGHDVYATVMAFTVGIDSGRTPSQVVSDLAKVGRYRRALLDSLLDAHAQTTVRRPKRVTGEQLVIGMQVDQDVVTVTGLILIRGGEILTESMAIRLRHFAAGVGVLEPINVLV
jgi:CheY-like chemotaxis protein